MTNEELKRFVDDRVNGIHKRLDEAISKSEKSAEEFNKHEKACAEQQGKVNEKLNNLQWMARSIMAVLAALGVTGIAFAFYMITGTWPS